MGKNNFIPPIKTQQSNRFKKRKPRKKISFPLVFLVFSAVFLVICIIFAPKIKYEYDISVYKRDFSEYVSTYSQKNNLDEAFVYAVIFSESSFNPEAVSEVNAIGLMQITNETFDWIKFKMADINEENTRFSDLFNPEINIKYGTFLLSLHITEFETERNALAAYHAGRGQLQSWLKNKEYSKDGENLTDIPFKKTNYYVHKVLEVKEKYEKLYHY